MLMCNDTTSGVKLVHLQEAFLADLVSKKPDAPELVEIKAKQLKLPLHGPVFVVGRIAFRNIGVERNRWGAARYLLRQLLYECADTLGMEVYAFPDLEGRLECVFSTEDASPNCRLEQLLTRLSDKIRAAYNMEIVAGIGSAVSTLEELYISDKSALTALQYQNLLNKDRVVHYIDLQSMGVLSHAPVYDHIRNLFRLRKVEELGEFIRTHSTRVGDDQNYQPGFLFECIAIITGEALNAGFQMQQMENCANVMMKVFQSRDAQESTDAVVELTEQLIKKICAKNASNSGWLITVAKEYIQKNMSNDQLNLEQVSNHVGLSRIYFCKRFHQLEGISFSNYLKEVRIEKAKQLLSGTNMKVFEAGCAVGLSNPKYFSYVFKRATGQTPLEFQKLAKKGASL